MRDHWLDWRTAKPMPTPSRYRKKRPGQAYRAGDDWAAGDRAWVKPEREKAHLAKVHLVKVDTETGDLFAIVKSRKGFRLVPLEFLHLERPGKADET